MAVVAVAMAMVEAEVTVRVVLIVLVQPHRGNGAEATPYTIYHKHDPPITHPLTDLVDR